MRRSDPNQRKLLGFGALGILAVAALSLFIFGGFGSADDLADSGAQSSAGGSIGSLGGADPAEARDDTALESPVLSVLNASIEEGDGAAGSGLPPIASQSVGADRKIIQTASLSLQVDRVGESFEEVGRIAAGLGGFVSSSSFSLQGEDEIASLTIRVPAERAQDALL